MGCSGGGSPHGWEVDHIQEVGVNNNTEENGVKMRKLGRS
jgi:hypothetical protein